MNLGKRNKTYLYIIWKSAVQEQVLGNTQALLWGNLIAASQNTKEASKKDGEGHFTQVCSVRTKGNSFKLKKGRLRSDIRKKLFYYEGIETLEEVVQSSCGWSSTGTVQGQVVPGIEQS